MNTIFYNFETTCHMVDDLKANGNKVVFVHGIFDILHEGHLAMLYEAKKLGNYLIVGLDSDRLARQVKGRNRPIRAFESRCLILSQVRNVDAVFKTDCAEAEDKESYYADVYSKLKPNIVASNIDAGQHGYLKQKQATRFNIEFVDIHTSYPYVSTTNFLEKRENKN